MKPPHFSILVLTNCLLICDICTGFILSDHQKNATIRIIGGELAGPNEFPSIIFLGTVSWDRRTSLHCGASIVNANFILTAAHCCDAQVNRYMAVAGIHDIQAWWTKSSWQSRRVIQKHVHPNYRLDRGRASHDICVMRVDQPFSFNSQVQPGQFSQATVEPGTILTTAGWGRTVVWNPQSISSTLRKTDLNAVAYAQCQRDYQGVLDDSMMCAQRNGKSSCMGDSGGILLNAATRQQVGIVSWGRGPCATNFPGVYTSIQKFLPWIRTMTRV